MKLFRLHCSSPEQKLSLKADLILTKNKFYTSN